MSVGVGSKCEENHSGRMGEIRKWEQGSLLCPTNTDAMVYFTRVQHFEKNRTGTLAGNSQSYFLGCKITPLQHCLDQVSLVWSIHTMS